MQAFQKRLRERLAELLSGARIEPQRLAQEAAILADRSDIGEELVRLKTHAGQLRGAAGRRRRGGQKAGFPAAGNEPGSQYDFSKTGGLGDLGLTITDLALAAKAEIDKIREQSLNLE